MIQPCIISKITYYFKTSTLDIVSWNEINSAFLFIQIYMNLAEFPGVVQVTHSYSRRLPARLLLNYDFSWSAGVARRIHPGVYPIPMGSLKNVSHFWYYLGLAKRKNFAFFAKFLFNLFTKKCENAKKFGIKKKIDKIQLQHPWFPRK